MSELTDALNIKHGTEIKSLIQERDLWKRVAIYLADCHAATAVCEGEMKSVPKARKQRYAEICRKALEYLDGGDPHTVPDEEKIRKRLQFGIEVCEASSS
jgi:hypothetical protein